MLHRAVQTLFSYIVLLLVVCSIAKAHVADTKKRVIDEDISKEPHELDGQHNAQYDHEAFLGKQDSKRFDDLTPDESKERLGLLVDKIDTDGDGKVTPAELSAWITHASNSMNYADVQRDWSERGLADDGKLTWETHVRDVFGEDGEFNEEDEETRKNLLIKDERRWKAADEDNDGMLSKSEFFAFLHPESSQKMRPIVVQETIDDLDKNKDGLIDVQEYISDLWSPTSADEEEPDWIAGERDEFKNRRDLDGDGKLNMEEVGKWIMPDNYDHVESETKHLFSEADSNQDNVLTKDEILDHYQLFVGSQATNYGEALVNHDEL